MKSQLFRYIFSGIFAITLDFLIYSLLIIFFPYWMSKGVGFISGSITAFLLNKYWTFQRYHNSIKEMGRFVVLYGMSMSTNIVCNALVLELSHQVLIAFGIATSLSTLINYFGQRFWVFSAKSKEITSEKLT